MRIVALVLLALSASNTAVLAAPDFLPVEPNDTPALRVNARGRTVQELMEVFVRHPEISWIALKVSAEEMIELRPNRPRPRSGALAQVEREATILAEMQKLLDEVNIELAASRAVRAVR